MTDERWDKTRPDTSAGQTPLDATPSDSRAERAGQDAQPVSPSSETSLPPSPFQFCFRAMASLQLAVVLIALYAVVLAVAPFIEKYYGPAAAYTLVYGTAWFAAIHVMLAVNVLCAMLIRLPWRRRQIGFLVTHGGILVLLAGCAATRWLGVEAMLPIYEGHPNHIAEIAGHGGDADSGTPEPLELGFQVYLRQFRRRLDPGSEMPSYYSSRVDFVEHSDPPKPLKDEKKLQEDVLIELNAPVDFADPQTGRTYRFFQASFEGPWLPGDDKFEQLAGRDRSRDQIYLSRLSMNYDPGRWPKYIGSFLIVLGIGIVYYLRRGLAAKPLAVSHAPPKALGRLLVLGVAISLFLVGKLDAQDAPLDWTTWRQLPVFSEGRVAPLDTFARETVRAICGRPNPTLVGPDASPDGRLREFSAAELLFAWLAEPDKWEDAAFLPADDERLREAVGLPLEDGHGRRLRGVSPRYVRESEAIKRRLAEIMHRADVEGKDFQLSDVEKKLDRLIDAYGAYRAWTVDPRSQHDLSRRFINRARSVNDALDRLRRDRVVAKRISKEPKIRQEVLQTSNAWGDLLGVLHKGDFSPAKIEPAVAKFRRSADRLASLLRSPDDAVATALAANLPHQAAQTQMAVYDDGERVRLVPALDPGALEESRTPENDASPWLSLQTLMYGSNDLLGAYPQPELKRMREAFTLAKDAYTEHGTANRAIKFPAAMDRFAASLRALAEKTEPLREQLPLRHRDQALIDATAYPPPGSTAAEVFYNRLDPFFWSWAVSLAATLCLLVAVGNWQKPVFWLGTAVLVVGQGIAIIGMVFRWHITGFVPLTGMFETVEFVALYSGLLGLWFALSPLWRWSLRAANGPLSNSPTRIDLVMQRRLFAVAGAIVSFTAAVLAFYAPATVMHRNIGSVTPILRDNFWLAVHVVTIMASYASAAIALILGCIALGYYLFGRYRGENNVRRRPPEACRMLARFIYTAIQITVLLLAAGTILGAFWADKAWGHFWSWDPKEVWALISLLVYLLILHLRCLILRKRSLGWSGDFAMAVAAVFGFTAILFTWYFVNFVMGSGMHSYGSGSGGMWAVNAAIAVTWLFLFAAAARHLLEIIGSSSLTNPQPSPLSENEETGRTGS